MKVQVVSCLERKGVSKTGSPFHFWACQAVATNTETGEVAVGEFTQNKPVTPGTYTATVVPIARDGRLMFSVGELKVAGPVSAAAPSAARA